MNKTIIPLAVCVFAAAAQADADFNPPAWRGLPNSTTQGWEFIFGNTYSGDLSDNSVVTTRNANELPTNIVPFDGNPSAPCVLSVFRQRISQPNLSDDFLTLLGAVPEQGPARLLLGIPNFASDSASLMRIQITYRIAVLPSLYVLHVNGLTTDPDAITYFGGLTDRLDPEGSGWSQATIDFEFNHTSGWQGVAFINYSGLELDIRSIVIDTIVPTPAAGALLGLGGLMAIRRRR